MLRQFIFSFIFLNLILSGLAEICSNGKQDLNNSTEINVYLSKDCVFSFSEENKNIIIYFNSNLNKEDDLTLKYVEEDVPFNSYVKNVVFLQADTKNKEGYFKIIYKNKSKVKNLISFRYSFDNNLSLGDIDGALSFDIINNDKLENSFNLNVTIPLNKFKFLNFEKPKSCVISVNDTNIKDYNNDLLLKKDFKIKIDTKKSSEFLKFYFDTVDDSCSNYYNVSNNKVILQTPQNQDIKNTASFKCINILQTNPKENLLIDFDIFNYSASDLIEIRDGSTKYSNLLAFLNPPSKENINNLYKSSTILISNKNYLYILMESNNVNKRSDYSQLKLIVENSKQKYIYKYFNNEEVKDLKIPKKELAYILFTSEPGKNAYLTLKENLNLKNSKIKIYDSFDLSKQPILFITNNKFLYKNIWSTTNVLVIEFMNDGDEFVFNGKFSSDENICQGIYKMDSVFTLTSSPALVNKDCKFYIQNNSSFSESLIISLSTVYLPSKDDFISLERIDAKSTPIFKNSGPINKNNIPEIELDCNTDYLLTYSIKSKIDHNQLLLRGFFESLKNSSFENYTLKENEVLKLNSTNYPENYRSISEKIININSSQNIYASILNLNLYSTDSLNILSGKPKGLISLNNVPDDRIYNNITFLFHTSLDNVLNRPENILYNGYNIELSLVKYSKMVYESPIIYDSSINNDYIWIIDNLEKNSSNYFTFELKLNGKADNFGELLVYDDSTKKRNIFTVLNKTSFENKEVIYFNTSLSKTIIEYKIPKDLKSSGFNLSFTKFKCPYDDNNHICDTNRCILDSIRCDKKNHCRDFKDELYCNSTVPPLPPIIKNGVSAWVIILVIIPLSIIFGIFVTLKGPKFLSRFRNSYYHEFNTFTGDT